MITTAALVIGLVVVTRAPTGRGHAHRSVVTARGDGHRTAKSEGFDDFLVSLVPTSAVQAFAEGDILQVLVFSVLFACGLASLGDRAQPVLDIVGSAQQTLFWIIGKVMRASHRSRPSAPSLTVSKYGLETLDHCSAN
ncbi:cation:dicarboxylate symporter family transporter [Streptomyces sp. L7]